ncbi:unnamed protein product [Bursaphelenchus xylophilus]|uniref:(pine wood nematode) hypothetical protein n=1 Tax=Bursaphelenchus xylophilus TaxID=6326 RepID=A0A7I8XAN9_BURXY|nr:unnamed protein product [Bursaphelenchus xylophilus]CAG9132049.1 unnamed protein product [Bursaphelenchus xylophilus]
MIFTIGRSGSLLGRIKAYSCLWLNVIALRHSLLQTGTTDPQRRTEMLHLSHVLHTDQNMNHSLRKYPNNYCEDGDSGKPNRPPESDWRKQWRTARGARF